MHKNTGRASQNSVGTLLYWMPLVETKRNSVKIYHDLGNAFILLIQGMGSLFWKGFGKDSIWLTVEGGDSEEGVRWKFQVLTFPNKPGILSLLVSHLRNAYTSFNIAICYQYKILLPYNPKILLNVDKRKWDFPNLLQWNLKSLWVDIGLTQRPGTWSG